jgi:copper homeostasis protein
LRILRISAKLSGEASARVLSGMAIQTATFELCAPSLAAAIAADRGGADRIELCTNLSVGGVTPDAALLGAVVRAISIPVYVLIRPRAGDFVFTTEEFAQMRGRIEQVKAAGARGVALGVLLPDSRVDVERSRELTEVARPMRVTFHRAFDVTPDLEEALEAVIETGADSVLTSGGASDVLTGAEAIARLRRQAGTRIEVMAGGGLRLGNVEEVLSRTGVSCLHGSLSSGMNGAGAPHILEQDIREAVRILKSGCAQVRHAAHTD